VSPSYPFSTSLPIRVYLGPKCATSFMVERYVIQPTKCETCVQHDKRDEQRSVLNRHRWKTNSTPEPCLVASNFSIWSPIIYQHMVCQSEFISAQNVPLASWSKGTLFSQLNVRHVFNMTRGTSNDRSLTDTDGKLIAPQNPVWLPPTFPFGLQLSINTWLFSRYHPFYS
jgi:hypothetical protein